MPTQKTYVKCSAKEHRFDGGGAILKLGFNAAELIRFAEQHKNERGYLNLCVSERREPGQYGDTHCVWLDTFKPGTKATPSQPKAQESARPDDDSPVPF